MSWTPVQKKPHALWHGVHVTGSFQTAVGGGYGGGPGGGGGASVLELALPFACMPVGCDVAVGSSVRLMRSMRGKLVLATMALKRSCSLPR